MYNYLVFEEDASRIELIVRIFYNIGLGLVFWLYSILANIVFMIQWILILFLGERTESLTNVLIDYIKYFVQFTPYSILITDKQPGIMPKRLNLNVDGIEYLTFEKDASRIELIVRIFYQIPLMIITFFYAIIAEICCIIQIVLILILGKRYEGINGIIIGFVKYIIQYLPYLMLVTDEHPEIEPRDINISIEIFD
jgi:hypothetical protein